ncbi:MAG: hypothetical protein U0894_01090 [Pirellulales bacterium]
MTTIRILALMVWQLAIEPLAISETKHLFVEFKNELKPDFNHTFAHLEAVLCWTSKLRDGTEVTDLGGTKGTYSITKDPAGNLKRFIVIPNSPRNVEVIVFKELLESKVHTFKPIGNRRTSNRSVVVLN